MKSQAWEKLAGFREEVLSALETARDNKIIASSLEAKVTLTPRADLDPAARQKLFDLIRSYLAQLPGLFIVSQVEVSMNETPGPVIETAPHGELIVTVGRADGKKCERCWNYSTHVGENPRYPTVCERCSEALAEIESDGAAGVAAR